MKARRRFHSAGVLAAVAALLVVVLAYDRIIRRTSLGEEFRYIPRENVLLVATGDLASLWRAAEAHVGGGEKGKEGPLGELFRKASEGLRKEGIEKPADLRRFGIDKRRGVLYSQYRMSKQGRDKFVAVVPIIGRPEFEEAIIRWAGERPSSVFVGRRGPVRFTASRLDDVLVAFPQPGLGVISNSPLLMQRSLLLQEENYSHAANNDALFKAIRRVLRRPLLVGPSVFAFWQPRAAPFGELAAAADFGQDRIRFEADIDVSGGGLRILEELLQPAPGPATWAGYLPAETLAAVNLSDGRLVRYLRFLSDLGELEATPLGQALEKLRRVQDISQAVIAVTGYTDGLPDLVVGIQGGETEMQEILGYLRAELRQQRDRLILERAIEDFRKQDPELPTVPELQRLGFLAPEDHALFDRYRLDDRGIHGETLHRQDLENDRYYTVYRGHRIEFLAPRLTKNDERYRPELYKGGQKGDGRYRVASVRLDGALWLTTDPADLHGLIDRAAGDGGSLAASASFRAVQAGWPGGEKLQLFVDVDQILSAVLLDGVNVEELDEELKKYLVDAEHHPLFGLAVRPTDGGRRLHLSAQVLQRGAR